MLLEFIHLVSSVMLHETSSHPGKEVVACGKFFDIALETVFGERAESWVSSADKHEDKEVTLVFGQLSPLLPRTTIYDLSI